MADRSERTDGSSLTRAVRDALIQESRDELVRSGRHLTIEELAARTGRSRDAARKWVARQQTSGRLVVVRPGRELLVPDFQLTADGDIDPAAAAVVEQLTAGGMTGWAVWRWAATPNTWLGGSVPAEVLRADPAAVQRAVTALFQ